MVWCFWGISGMFKYREKTFETNSSSTNSFSILKESTYKEWRRGAYYIYIENYSEDNLEEDELGMFKGCNNKAIDTVLLWKRLDENIEDSTLYTPEMVRDILTENLEDCDGYFRKRSKKAIELLNEVVDNKIPYNNEELLDILKDYKYYTYESLRTLVSHIGVSLLDEHLAKFVYHDRKYKGLVLVGYEGYCG